MTERERQLIADLADCLEETHQEELNNAHGGDSKAVGYDPATCSYCRAIERANKFLGREV